MVGHAEVNRTVQEQGVDIRKDIAATEDVDVGDSVSNSVRVARIGYDRIQVIEYMRSEHTVEIADGAAELRDDGGALSIWVVLQGLELTWLVLSVQENGLGLGLEVGRVCDRTDVVQVVVDSRDIDGPLIDCVYDVLGRWIRGRCKNASVLAFKKGRACRGRGHRENYGCCGGLHGCAYYYKEGIENVMSAGKNEDVRKMSK